MTRVDVNQVQWRLISLIYVKEKEWERETHGMAATADKSVTFRGPRQKKKKKKKKKAETALGFGHRTAVLWSSLEPFSSVVPWISWISCRKQ